MFDWLKNIFHGDEPDPIKNREARLDWITSIIRASVTKAVDDAEHGISPIVKKEQIDSGIRLQIIESKEPIKLPASRSKEFDPSTVSEAMTFAQCLSKLINKNCGGLATVCYWRAGLSRQTFSKVMSTGGMHVSKLTALRLCIGSLASMREAAELLECAGYAFSRASYEDAIFKWCLEKRIYDMKYINEILVRCNCKPCDLDS